MASKGTYARKIGHKYAYAVMERSIGFAMMWHNLGGDKGLAEHGITRSTLYSRKAEFKKIYGFPVEEFEPTSAYNEAKRVAAEAKETKVRPV